MQIILLMLSDCWQKQKTDTLLSIKKSKEATEQ